VTRQPKTALELEKIVADFLGFDQNVIMVERIDDKGGFRAIVTGPTAWLTKASAQLEVDKTCAKLKSTYMLRP
jgi:hypothetical protein